MARATPPKQEVLPFEVKASEAEKLLTSVVKIQSDKAMFVFNNHVLRRASNFNLKNFQIYEASVVKKGNTIHVNRFDFYIDDKKFSVLGAANSKKDARHRTAGAVIDKLLEINPKLFMPKYCIGLPNFRGHCFMIPVLVPIFFDKVLVHSMCLLNSDDPDLANLKWIKILKEIFVTYRQVSYIGQYSKYFLPKGIEKKYPLIYKNVDTSTIQYPPGKKDLLEVDRRMICLCMELRDKVSFDYATPRGNHCRTILHLMAVINEEFLKAGKESPIQSAFGIDFNYSYSCTNCKEKMLKARYAGCHLVIQAKTGAIIKSIQDYFDFPEFLIRAQDNGKCKRFKDGAICLGDFKRIGDFRLTKAPNTLVFLVAGEDKWIDIDDNIAIPDELKIQTTHGYENYICFAKSFSIEVWKFEREKDDEDIILRDLPHPDFYEKDGNHVFLLIRTNKGWIEVNNEDLYKPLKPYDKVQPFQLIFYCKTNQICLPEIVEDYIDQ